MARDRAAGQRPDGCPPASARDLPLAQGAPWCPRHRGREAVGTTRDSQSLERYISE